MQNHPVHSASTESEVTAKAKDNGMQGIVWSELTERERDLAHDLGMKRDKAVAALRRLTTVCKGAGWVRHPGDAIEQAEEALRNV